MTSSVVADIREGCSNDMQLSLGKFRRVSSMPSTEVERSGDLKAWKVILGSTSREMCGQHAASLLCAGGRQRNAVVQVPGGPQGGSHLPRVIAAAQHHHCTKALDSVMSR